MFAVPASVVTMLAALAIVWCFHSEKNAIPLLFWFCALALISGLRLRYGYRLRDHFTLLQGLTWERRYVVLQTLSGIAWGALLWIPLQEGSHAEITLLLLVFCVLPLGGSTLAASPRSFLAFSSPIALSLFVRLFSLDTDIFLVSVFGLLASIVLFFFSLRLAHLRLIDALNARYETQDLLLRQEAIFESAAEGIVIFQPRQRPIFRCNRRLAEMLGHAPRSSVYAMESAQWLIALEDWQHAMHDAAPVIARGETYHEVVQLRHADGSPLWVRLSGKAIRNEPETMGTVWVISDLTPQRQTEAALRASEQRFRELVELSSDLYWEQDAQFRFVSCNGRKEALARLPIDTFIGRRQWEIVLDSGVSAPRWKEHISCLERHRPFRDFVSKLPHRDGNLHWYSSSGNPLFDGNGVFIGYHGTAHDVTDRVINEAHFRHLAYHDLLTQLPNRLLFEDRLAQAVRLAGRSGQRLAVLLLDLDGFKRINDEYGHAAGDCVLQESARRLREIVRESDTVARWGGDEFIVLLAGILEREDAQLVAEKIHEVITQPIAVGTPRVDVDVGTSIGISLYPEHGDSGDALIRCADIAMYDGKRQGGRRTRIFSMDMLSIYAPQPPH